MSDQRTACAECRELIGGYVLDALEPDEMEAVRRHLAECPECAAEHARLDDLPGLLTLAGPPGAAPASPPAALEEAVLDRFAREHRPARRAETPRRSRSRSRAAAILGWIRQPLPAAAVGALAATIIAAVLVLAPGDEGTANGEIFNASLSGSSAAPAAHASARLETSSAGTQVRLKVAGLSGNPDNLYELWCVRDDGTRVSAGTFRVNAQGKAVVNLTTAASPGEYHRMSVERRSLVSAAEQPVMAGEIRYGS
jgi:anti-sigma-K factor RskA